MKYKKYKANIGTYSSTKELLPGLNKAVNASSSTLKVRKGGKKHGY